MTKASKIRQLKKQRNEANRKLAIANRSIFEQMAEIHALNSINEINEGALRIAEGEMHRKEIIIGYLEIKLLEKLGL